MLTLLRLAVISAVLFGTVSTGAVAEISWLPPSEGWADKRALYQKAAAELDSGAGNRYQEMRDELIGYPLGVDLDFSIKLGQLHDMTAEEARIFIASAAGTPLASRFLVAYLRHKAQDRRWQAYLEALDDLPAMPELQCHYYRAKLALGERDAAFEGAADLWNVGQSQERACDPLFEAWIAAAGPSDALVWSRALKAFDAKNGHLIRYVKRFASEPLQRDLDELMAVYRRPSRVEGDHHQATDRHADILVAGVGRLAQLSPARAYQTMISVRDGNALSPSRSRLITTAIVRHSLFAQRSPAPTGWVDAQVAALREDDLTVIWLRNAIARGQWEAVQRGLSWLSEDLRAQDRWRYWSARSGDALRIEGTESIWQGLAMNRSFHGFLAADKLKVPYALNEVVPRASLPEFAQATRLGVGRTQELLALGDRRQAKEQWRHTLNQMSRKDRARLGEVALQRNWLDLAADAANAGAAWDRLDLRFPMAYWERFQAASRAFGIDAYDLIALARRESGLYPLARSKVGARGLMQIMPATAQSVARKQGDAYGGTRSLYEPSTSIALGAAYYSDLMSRYEDNRVKTLVAYNAGPSRVTRWSDGTMALDQWVDSIPFGETREYVQAVLAYTVIYRARGGVPAPILTAAERDALY